MEKFLNLMYDFFAFSLPGLFIIGFYYIPIKILQEPSTFLKYFDEFNFPTLLIIAVLGYVIGYIITPITRFFLLICIAYIVKLLWIKLKAFFSSRKTKGNEITKFMNKFRFIWQDKRGDEFAKIRKDRPLCFQYIQFWSMHMTMAHNLAGAFILGLVMDWNNGSNGIICCEPIVGFVIFVVPALLLIILSYKFSDWWYSEISADLKK